MDYVINNMIQAHLMALIHFDDQEKAGIDSFSLNPDSIIAVTCQVAKTERSEGQEQA